MLLKGVTPVGIAFKGHCYTYLLCRLQNRLWTTAPEYQIYGNRLPVSLGKERTITTGFQPSHTLRYTKPSHFLGTFIFFFPLNTYWGTLVFKYCDSIIQFYGNTSPVQQKHSSNKINIYKYPDPRYKTSSLP